MYDINKTFSHHPPKDGQEERYAVLRATAKEFAKLLLAECPDSRERALALTNLEQSVMWANAAIARSE